MNAYLEQNGYVNDINRERLHHEIYMSDARRVAPEKWKTVIRHPIKKAQNSIFWNQETDIDEGCITIQRDDGWKAFRIQGVLDFSLIGILAKIATVLADNGISIGTLH